MRTEHRFESSVKNRIRCWWLVRNKGNVSAQRITRQLIRDAVSHLRRHRAWKKSGSTTKAGFQRQSNFEAVRAARVAEVVAEKGKFENFHIVSK